MPSYGKRRERDRLNIKAAPICTLGPSRPIDAPLHSPTRVSNTLPTATRSDNRRRRTTSEAESAAMVWGIPLPWAPGK